MNKFCDAVVFTGVGNYEIDKIEVPKCGHDDLLIRTLCCGICQREIHVISGRLSRNFPNVMGHEVVGIVEECGENVSGIEIGDMVACITNSGLAEYCIGEGMCTQKINYDIDKPVYFYLAEPLMCCLSAIRKTNLKFNDRVLVIGAGFMGNLLVQALTRHIMYGHIDVYDLQEDRLKLIPKSYNVSTLTKHEYEEKSKYDVVYEVTGADGIINVATRKVRNGGKLCLFGHHFSVENEAVNDWHLRGINIMNTVPWASDNLALDFKNAVYSLNNNLYSMENLITHVYRYDQFGELLNNINEHKNDIIKSVITFNETK